MKPGDRVRIVCARHVGSTCPHYGEEAVVLAEQAPASAVVNLVDGREPVDFPLIFHKDSLEPLKRDERDGV